MINAGQQLRKLTECCICFKGFTDPRILSCIHTFCLECLRRTGEASKKEPGENVPCPLCRKEFVIPPEGMNGLQKNFFMEDLMENLKNVAIQSQMDDKPILVCDMCKAFYEEDAEKTEAATMQCLECKDNYCDACAKRHQLSKASSTHRLLKIGSETETVIRKIQPIRYCSVHNQEPLNLYCIDCKKILCMLCSVEKHESHKRQAVTTVHKEFRKAIQQDAMKISKCIEEIRSKENMMDEKKEEVLLAVAETEVRIKQRNVELKAMIDSQTNSMLVELSLIKQTQIKHFANTKEEIDRFHTILESFKTYCTELITKGSDCDVCCSVEGLTTRTSELLKDHKEFIARPFQMTKVSFENIEQEKLLDQPCNNIIGRIECRSTDCSYERPDSASIFSVVETSTIIIGSASMAEDHDSASKVHEPDPISNDDVVTNATDETRKEKATNERLETVTESEQQSSSSMRNDLMERLENVVTTSGMPAKEDQDYEGRGHLAIAFPDAIAKHKEMLKKMRDQLIRIESQQNDKRSSLFLKKEHAEKFRQQFGHVKCILSDRWETAEWKSIELCHDKLMKLICAETEGLRFEGLPVLEEVKGIIEDILKNLNILEASSQQGLRNTINNYYFNAVIQCLCQTYLLLDALCSTTTPEQRLTEEFIEFSSVHGHLSPAKQKEAFSRFYKQLCASQSKFSNFRQYDSHDLFIEFLNLLRSEERLHTAKDPRFKGDTSKVLTAVEKVFGGHFITACTCLSCDRTQYVCKDLLDISLPIITPNQQHSSKRATTVDKRRELRRSLNSDQHKEMMRSFLEALSEEKNIQEEGDRGDFSRPVTITDCLRSYTTECVPKDNHCLSCQGGLPATATATVETMPSVVKRTLIYDPPAILVLHMKRFHRTATGLEKRSQKVTYEELLDIGPYCSSDCLRIDPEDKNIWYSLYGVVVHIGSLESGHYVAYVKVGKSKSKATKTFLQKRFLDRDQVATKRKQMLESGGKRANRKEEWDPIPSTDEKWIQVSDNNTRDVTSSEALKQEAFMLFYERIPKYGL